MRRVAIREKPQVRRDLDEIFDYIAADNIEAADRFIDSYYDTVKVIEANPMSGSPRNFALKDLVGLRMTVIQRFPRYVIYYIPHPQSVEILRVLHSARNAESLF